MQLAKHYGAHVTAVCGTANVGLVRSLGADEVIDYNAHKFEDKVSGVDSVLDTIGGEVQHRSWKTLRPKGTLVSIVHPASPAIFLIASRPK